MKQIITTIVCSIILLLFIMLHSYFSRINQDQIISNIKDVQAQIHLLSISGNDTVFKYSLDKPKPYTVTTNNKNVQELSYYGDTIIYDPYSFKERYITSVDDQIYCISSIIFDTSEEYIIHPVIGKISKNNWTKAVIRLDRIEGNNVVWDIQSIEGLK